jgi:hypothetical protein
MAAPRGTLLPHGSTLHSAFQSQILARRPRCRGNHRTLGARHGPASLLTCPPNAAPAVHHRQQLILPPLSRSTGDFYRPVSATLTNRQCPHVRNATVGTGPVAQETRPLPRCRSLGAAPLAPLPFPSPTPLLAGAPQGHAPHTPRHTSRELGVLPRLAPPSSPELGLHRPGRDLRRPARRLRRASPRVEQVVRACVRRTFAAQPRGDSRLASNSTALGTRRPSAVVERHLSRCGRRWSSPDVPASTPAHVPHVCQRCNATHRVISAPEVPRGCAQGAPAHRFSRCAEHTKSRHVRIHAHALRSTGSTRQVR